MSGGSDPGSPAIVAGMGQCSWDHLFFIDTYPPPDSKQEAYGLVQQGGGPVATALVALQRLGVRTRFAGVVGDDIGGQAIRASLVAEGVDAGGIVTRADSVSQTAFIAVERSGGRRTIFWQRPTGEALSPGEVSAGFLDGASLLMLDGLMPEVSIVLARRAREMGLPVLLDAGRMREGMMELATLCDHVVGSEVFGVDIGMDTRRPEAFNQSALEMIPGTLTITLGSRGCVAYGPQGAMAVPAFGVEPVDTTGAGDVFHAGYACGVLNGLDLMGTLRFASAAAALSTKGLGGRGTLPGLEDVLRLLSGGENK